jgi:hypothetical protein
MLSSVAHVEGTLDRCCKTRDIGRFCALSTWSRKWQVSCDLI